MASGLLNSGNARLAPSSRLVLRRFQPPPTTSPLLLIFIQHIIHAKSVGVRNAPKLASLSPQHGDTISVDMLFSKQLHLRLVGRIS